MSYVIKTFLLVSSSVRGKQLLCFLQGQGRKREQKHTTKNFVEFHNNFPVLTMLKIKISKGANKANQASQLYAYAHTLITALNAWTSVMSIGGSEGK